jgi:2-polyprenyl-3-methyl-5-hydroxy-6-metoxy-1,4-benzoquinol methylase
MEAGARPAYQAEQQRLDNAAGWYLGQQLDFDRQLVRFRYLTLCPHLRGPDGLELGPADGEMTRYLRLHFACLTVVDGAAELLDRIPAAPGLVKVCSLFEEFEPAQTFNTIVMEHVLEHVEAPVALLEQSRRWLTPGGRLLAGVPNGHSIHRLAAVKMGLLPEPCALNSRDRALGHRRVYTPDSLRRDLEAAGLRVSALEGVFFKPLSNQQIQDQWTPAMIQGFYEMGKGFPEHAAELVAVCEAA